MAAETAAVASKLAHARDTGILDLSGCKLVQIPTSVYIFIKDKKITKCDLSNNEIKTIPPQLLQHLSHVEDLNLANNQLGHIPDDINLLKNVQKLNIQHNNLTLFCEGIYRLESLVELQLQDNHIEYIDLEQLPYMRSLRHLHLEENELSEDVMDALREYEEEHEDVFIRLG